MPPPESARSAPRTTSLEAPAACTIIARNYLSYAAILAESYLKHEPGARFYLLVVDGLPPEAVVPEGVRVIAPEDLELPTYFEMCFKYDVTELCTAVKPAFMSLLLTRYSEASVIYFDPDIVVMRPLEELKAAMASADIVLIPHLLDPIPQDRLKPSEQDILIAGVYNLGFLALRASEAASRLLTWWGARLKDGCRVDPAHGLFVDQRWMDLAPSLFPTAAVLRDPTYDVAYWNLHSRMPECHGSEFLVGGRPLAFFHFSGFDPRQPKTLSKHQTRTSVQKGSALAELLEAYAEGHRKHGHAVSSRWPYGYSRFSNGVPLSLVFRHLYLDLDEPRRQAFGDPFEVDGAGSFFEWAVRPQVALGGLNPFLKALHRLRTDLPSAFPDLDGNDRRAFLEWARGQGAREMDYPPEIVPADEPSAADRGDLSSARWPAPQTPATGINVAGYLRNETGIGAVARGYVAALQSVGVPVALKDFSVLSPNRSEDPTLAAFDDVHPHPVNLVCANADQHFVVASHLRDAFFRNRRNIGVWFWELPEFPAEWHDRFPHYDEIWAPSSFIANALAAVSLIPIVRMPAVLAGETGGDRPRGRARVGVSADEFVWLFVFDFHSYVERKNPLGLIAAFKKAFAPTDPVHLVIKCVNSAFDAEAFRSMQAVARGHRITIHDGYWSTDQMRDLLAACDGYASLHRSEGLGVPLASAMWLGKPVVATDWSGNTDFMNVGNSFPVRYELVKLAADVGPYRAGSTWADPAVDHAAELLRQVFEGGEEIVARAQAGQRTIAAEYSVEAVARCLERRLAVIRGGQVSRTSSNLPAHEAPAFAPPAVPGSRYDLTPVLPPLDLQTSQHGRLGRWGKRAVGFLLRYHSFHQQRVNTILAGSLGDLVGRIQKLSEQMDRGQAQAREDLNAAVSATSALASRAQDGAVRVGRLERTAAEKVEVELVRKSLHGLAAHVEAAVARLARVEGMAALIEETAVVARKVEEGIEAAGRSIQTLEGRLATSDERTARAVHGQNEQVRAMASSFRELESRLTVSDEQTAAALVMVKEQIEASARSLSSLESQFTQVSAGLEHAAARSDETAGGLRDALAALSDVRTQAAGGGQLVETLRSRLEELAAKTAHLGHRFAVRPYMGVDPFGATGDLSKPMEYGPGSTRPTFEDVFRGPRELIAERQRAYLPLLEGIDTLVDLGCGRGEFLSLMAEAGIPAVGVEKNPELVAAGRARGLKVVKADALRYLRARPRGSLGAIFSAQFIEHLPPEKLGELLALSLSRLRKGGLFIAETPNPESFEALKTFHVDLTHHKPIYPQVLLHMCLDQGYSSARIFYPVGGGFTQQQYETAGEYAVVATR